MSKKLSMDDSPNGVSENILTMGEKLLEASLLLERWEKWSNTYGDLVNAREICPNCAVFVEFSQLTKDTDTFFKVSKIQENL